MTKTRTFKAAMQELLPSDKKFNVIAYELTQDMGSWSVNTPFRIAREVDKDEVVSILKDRWDIFKVNYLSKARVKDISNISYNENEIELEVSCVPFIQIQILLLMTTTKTKHTHGEWRIMPSDDLDTLEIHDNLGSFCSCFKERANLIASAPELLEALKECLGTFQLLGSGQKPLRSNSEMCELVGNVISKAEGTL